MSSTYRNILANAIQQLQATSDSPRLDAEILLLHVLDKPNTFLIAHPEYVLDTQQRNSFQSLLRKRLQGHPIAHLTGHREFWSLDFNVNEHTLIPRPETETLVELALKFFPDNQPVQAVDLGTGTGAIAIAIAAECPQWNVHATDCSETALCIARNNAKKLVNDRIHFHQGSWFDAVNDTMFDLVISNPPYIALNDPHLMQGDVMHEPALALSSGKDGLNAIRIIVEQAKKHLNPNGYLLIEHGYDQQEYVLDLFIQHGYQNTTGVSDLAGNPRAVQAQWLP